MTARLTSAVAVACALALVGCAEAPQSTETVKLGLLLPFTGRAAGPSHNYERSVLLAEAQLHDVGIGGKPLEIVFGDTHSDLARGIAACEAMVAAGVVAIVAADSGELAEAILPLLRSRQVLLISPEISANSDGVGANLPWFRLAPSTRAMAESLARRLVVDRQVMDIVVLRTADGYNAAFAKSFQERFAQLGGRSVERTLSEDRRSYSDILPEIAGKPHALLAARPETAARLVNEMWSFGTPPRWYLTPALRADTFVLNATPQAVVGSIGVSPNVTIDPQFAGLFGRHWEGDVLLESSLFYFDAVALFAIGYERARQAAGSTPSAVQLAEGMLAAAFNRGIVAQWSELPSALTDARAGVVRYYRGLTGSIVLSPDGQRGAGQEKLWTIKDAGEIEDVR